MASVANLRLVHGFAEPRVSVAEAPEVVATEPMIIPVPVRPGRFWIAAALSLALHGGLVAAWSDWSSSGEARSEGGSEDLIIIEGASVVLLDSMPSAGSTGLPEAVTETTIAIESNADAEPAEAVAEAEPVEVADVPPMEVAALDAAPDITPVAPDAPMVAETVPPPVAKPLEAVEATAEPVEATAEVGAMPQSEEPVPAREPTGVASLEPVAEPIAVAVEPAIAGLAADMPIAPDAVISAQDAELVADAVAVERVAETQPADVVSPIKAEQAVAARPVETAEATVPVPDRVRTSEPVSDLAEAREPVADTAVVQPTEAREDASGAFEAGRVAIADDAVVAAEETPVHVAAVETVALPPTPKPAPAPPVVKPPAKAVVKTPPATEKKQATASRSSPPRPASQAQPTAQSRDRGTVGGGGRSSTETGHRSLSSYQAKLAAHLRRYRTYPAEARREGARGTAIVRFTVNSGGRVTAASLARSSGHRVLDREAVAMVRRASPFPPMPAGSGGSLTINAPVRFDVR